MIDADGKFTYSNIIRLTNNAKEQITIFPNPAKNIITVSGLKSQGEIKLITSEGKNIFMQKVTNQSQKIDISTLSKGVYFLEYITDKEIFRNKFIKQ